MYYIKRISAASFLLILIFSFTVIANAESLTNTPTHDSTVEANSPNRNNGQNQILEVSDYQGADDRAYLKFNLSSINTSQITDIKLSITPSLSRRVSKEIYLVENNSWSEDTITWANAPELTTKIGEIDELLTSGTRVHISLDQSQIKNLQGSEITLALTNTGSDYSLIFPSKESPSNKPQLIVSYTPNNNFIQGDANSDGKVDGLDFSIWLNNFGGTTSNGHTDGDFNYDKFVNGIDYTIWLNNYGYISTPTPTATPNSPTPQPTSNPTITPFPSPTITPTLTPTPTATPGTVASGPPGNCDSYPEPRTFLESQAWWWKRLPSQTGDDFGHVHYGTCFPHNQTLSGVVDFDVRIVMHHNPGAIRSVGFDIWGDNPSGNCHGNDPVCIDLSDNPLSCPNGETCAWWFNLSVDTKSLIKTDGLKEFRFRAFIDQPDNNDIFESTGWNAYLKNGNTTTNNYRSHPFIEGRGWYTGTEYQNSRVERLNINPNDPYSFQGTVSGIWRPVVDAKPGSGGNPTDHHIVMIDPAFHALPPNEGIIVKEGQGQLDNYQLSIDTTELTNGWHRLAIRTDDDFFDDSGECFINKNNANPGSGPCDSTLSNVLITWFYVKN